MSVLGRLSLLADGRRPPGVYAAHVDALAATCAAALAARGVEACALDTAGAPDKAAFLDRCARDLGLPAWFGRNWDALVDVLRERTGVVVWAGAAALDPDVADVALDVFRDRAREAPAFTVVVLDAPASLAVAPL